MSSAGVSSASCLSSALPASALVTPASADCLQLRKHVRFLVRHLNVFPDAYSSLDTNRVTLLFFALSGLDLLNELEPILTPESGKRQQIIDWIYRLQLKTTDGCPPEACGFRGSFSCSVQTEEGQPGQRQHVKYESANLAQTYSALLSLSILGDDLSRVDREATLNAISLAQKEDGSFYSQGAGSESDMRFVFCAVAVCHILGDQSAIAWDRLSQFIRRSVNYDGGIGQGPGDESHGGSTYCAVAALALADRLWDESVLSTKDIRRLVRWALMKQDSGFHGRANKPDDSCYAFWIGATLEMLNAHPLCGQDPLRSFLMSTQHPFMGGFCKLAEPGAYPDALHTYFSIAALSLLREPRLSPIYAPINVSRRAYERIRRSAGRCGCVTEAL